MIRCSRNFFLFIYFSGKKWPSKATPGHLRKGTMSTLFPTHVSGLNTLDLPRCTGLVTTLNKTAISLTAINDNFDCKNTLWQSIPLCLSYMIIILMIENVVVLLSEMQFDINLSVRDRHLPHAVIFLLFTFWMFMRIHCWQHLTYSTELPNSEYSPWLLIMHSHWGVWYCTLDVTFMHDC